MALVDRDLLFSHLTTAELGRPLHYFDETDSTNTRAMRALTDGTARHGALFVAGRQTAGRGTDGSRWVSAEPTGLWMSLVVEFDGRTTPAIALWPAIAVAKALRDGLGVDAHLKWPNDVLVGPRKIAGVLVESIARQSAMAAVVGIGVNLDQPSFTGELEAVAVSAKMVLRREVAIPLVFGRIMTELERAWRQPSEWTRQWVALTRMIGRRVELRQGGATRHATVESLTDEGFLQVRGDDGRPQVVISRGGLDVRVAWEDAPAGGLA